MKKILFAILILALTLTGCGAESYTEEYPEQLPDTVSWNEYPSDNILGLSGIGTYNDQGITTVILAIESRKCEFDKKIILKYEALSGACPYGWFEFDESIIYDEHTYDYVKLSYDSRIAMDEIVFDRGDERYAITFGDELTLFYIDFSDPDKTRTSYQTFDADKMIWNDTILEIRDVPPTVSAGPSVRRILDIDDSEYEPSHTSEDVTLAVSGYEYKAPWYNIYGEIEEPGYTVLQFYLKCDIHGVEKQDGFSLYRKVDGELVDITPADAVFQYGVELYGRRISVLMQSSKLEELSEGDYRLEYGPYYTDFRTGYRMYVLN